MAEWEDVEGRGAWDAAAAALDGDSSVGCGCIGDDELEGDDELLGWNLRKLAKRAKVAVTWKARYMRLKKKYIRLKRSRG